MRFSTYENYVICILQIKKDKEYKILQDLIDLFAEKDKKHYYGSKEQFDDNEDFYPFALAKIKIF